MTWAPYLLSWINWIMFWVLVTIIAFRINTGAFALMKMIYTLPLSIVVMFFATISVSLYTKDIYEFDREFDRLKKSFSQKHWVQVQFALAHLVCYQLAIFIYYSPR